MFTTGQSTVSLGHAMQAHYMQLIPHLHPELWIPSVPNEAQPHKPKQVDGKEEGVAMVVVEGVGRSRSQEKEK